MTTHAWGLAMVIRERLAGSSHVVELCASRLDASIADRFKSDMKMLIDDGAVRVVLDFRRIDFMDSTGLGALIGCIKHMRGRGVIEIACPKKQVRKALEMTRLDKIFPLRDRMPAG